MAKRARILIVDDAANVRSNLRRWLEGAGHEVVGEAEDGTGAVALFQEQRPDLVTLDLVLPGMAGLHVLRNIAETVPGLPVVVLSALDGEKFISQALEAGAVDYLCKPLDRDRVLMAVDKALVGGAG